MDKTLDPDEHEIAPVYDEFVYAVITVCTSKKGSVPAYFTIQYTYLELQQLQAVLNNPKSKKKFLQNYITRSLSFLTIALEWTRDNPQLVSVKPSSDTKLDSEPSVKHYIWGGSVTDLIELAIAIYNIKLIRKASGKLITFAEIIRALKFIFNIKIPKNIYSRKARTIERKKNPSSMLERLLAVYNHEVDKFYK